MGREIELHGDVDCLLVISTLYLNIDWNEHACMTDRGDIYIIPSACLAVGLAASWMQR